MYEFKIALFENGETEEFLSCEKLKYDAWIIRDAYGKFKKRMLRLLLCGGVLHEFKPFYAHIVTTNIINLNQILLKLRE